MECRFLSEPDDTLKCSICLEVARDPKQEETCGKLFCTICIEKLKENDSCPICRTPHARYFMDRRSHREIQALAVLCDNVESGCDWEGTVEVLETHTAQCGYLEMPCPNVCGENLLRKDLQDHLSRNCSYRESTCEHCGLTGQNIFITMIHDGHCEKKIVDCSSEGCNMRMERGQVASHIRESCDYTEVYCKYAGIGCEEKRLRKEMKTHEDDAEIHLSVALDTIVAFSRLKLENLADKHCKVTFKLNEYSEKRKSSKSHSFQPFFTSPSGYKLCFFVYPDGCGAGKGSHLSVFIKILQGPYDDRLEWPLNAVFTVEILNQLADDKHYKQIIPFRGDSDHCKPGSDGLGRCKFYALSKLTQQDNQNNTQYLKDDVLYVRVTISIPSHKPWLDHTHE